MDGLRASAVGAASPFALLFCRDEEVVKISEGLW
jgi:hypothetical protein